MKVIAFIILAFFGVLITSPAVAQVGGGLHVVEWREHVYSANTITGWDGDVVSVNLTRPHTWTVNSTVIDVEFTVNVGIDGSNLARTFLMSVDGTNLEHCLHAITVDGALTQRSSIGGGSRCPPTNAGVNQVTIGEAQNWTFSNIGTATVIFFIASVYVVVQDTVIMDFTVETALDFWLPLALLILVFAVSIWQGYTFPMLISSIGIAAQFFDTPPIAFVAIIFLLLVAFMLEYFVGGLRGLMGRRKDDDGNPW